MISFPGKGPVFFFNYRNLRSTTTCICNTKLSVGKESEKELGVVHTSSKKHLRMINSEEV